MTEPNLDEMDRKMSKPIGGDERPRVCSSCKHYGKLSPGHAAICFHKWKDLPWNAAVPLVSADDTCEAFSPTPR